MSLDMEQYFFKDQIIEAKEKLKHIKSPMSFYQILEEFGGDSYNSELLLQHALLCLLRQSFRVE
jgi:hypothetical protein